MLAICCRKGHSRTRRFAVPELHRPQAIQLLPHFRRVQTGVVSVGSLLLSSSALPPFPPLPFPLFLFCFVFFLLFFKRNNFQFLFFLFSRSLVKFGGLCNGLYWRGEHTLLS